MADLNVNRLGQKNNTGATDATWLTGFAGEIISVYERACLYKDRHQMRQVQHGKPIAHNERIITLDELLKADVAIAEIDELKNHYDVRSAYAKQLGDALAQAFDKNVARNAVLAARAAGTLVGEPGGSVLTGTASVSTSGLEIKDMLFLAAQVLDEKDIPSTDRYAFLPPVSYYAAASEPDLINKNWSSAGNMAKGSFESLADITIVKTNNVPQANDSNNQNIPAKYRGNFSKTAFHIMHKEAVGTAKLLDLSLETGWELLYQSHFMVAKYIVGHGILRPECAIEVVKP